MFLITEAFKSIRVEKFAGWLTMSNKQQTTYRLSSICGHPIRFSQNDSKYSQVFKCEIDVQNICYDFVAKFRFESQ